MSICDTIDQGNVLVYDVATPSQEPTAGDTVKFADGAIVVTMD